MTATILLGLLTIYMLVSAVLCSLRAVEFIDTPMYRNMVFSVLITYGVYFASSLLALDPYHLVTCFVQYVLLTPMYVNVLNMCVCPILVLAFLSF
jgi:chitin synthase